jgi:hypothetical protein
MRRRTLSVVGRKSRVRHTLDLAAWNYECMLQLARQEGLEEGRSELQVRLLRQKFGPLSKRALQCVREAIPAKSRFGPSEC